MPRCQICNRLLADNELRWNKRTLEFDFLCTTCRQAIFTMVQDLKSIEEEEEDDAQYRDGRCPMDR